MSTAATETEIAPEKLRVEIARGVLALLDEKKLIARRGLYFKKITCCSVDSDITFDRCLVCALGALFATHMINGFDNLESWQTGFRIDGVLTPIFGESQIGSIESYFEKHPMYQSDEACMREIMRNIIENGGTFNPTRTVEL